MCKVMKCAMKDCYLQYNLEFMQSEILLHDLRLVYLAKQIEDNILLLQRKQ